MARVDPKILTLRKLEAGDHEVMDSEGNSVGIIKHKHMMEHLRRYQEGLDQQFSSVGFGAHTSSADREVIRRVQTMMSETGLPFASAMARVLASDETLADKYRRAHSQVDDVDGPPRGGRSVVMGDAEEPRFISKPGRVLCFENGSHIRQTQKHGSNGRAVIAVLLTGEGTAVGTPPGFAMHRGGAQLRQLVVVVPGSWVKGDHSFSITKQDLADMQRNFEKRKNAMIVIDYEHASEQPDVAKGGPIPGAGWIHGLNANGKLSALVEWTPQAEEMLRSGQYRFFSPAIDWGVRDKTTGEPQGATLTSGALTNHPFLEELPPIMLSDGTVISTGGR